MNSILKITRKELLNEVAGISFIVREWAKILKDEVDEQNKVHREKEMKKISSEPKAEPTKPESQKYTQVELFDDDEKNSPFYWEDEFSKGKGSEGESKSGDWEDYNNWVKSDKKNLNFFYEKGKKWRERGYYKRRYEDKPISSYGDYKYGTYVPKPYIEPLKEIVVLGKKYPELYKKFSVDKWVFKDSGRIEYDHWHSGYDNEGNYVVYFNVPIQGLSMNAFIHEIKHAYDDWNRMSHGGKPIRDTWEIKNIYTPDFEKLVLGGNSKYPQLGPLIRYFYLGSKLETPAYLENEYDTTAINYEEVARKMKNFDPKNYFDKEGRPARGLEQEFLEMKKLDIPVFKKYENVTDFLNWVKKYFNKRGEDIFRRIAKMKYVHGKPLSPLTPKPVTYGSLGGSTYEPKEKSKEVEKYKKETGESDEFEEGETLGDWKYSSERGWYFAGEDGDDEYSARNY